MKSWTRFFGKKKDLDQFKKDLYNDAFDEVMENHNEKVRLNKKLFEIMVKVRKGVKLTQEEKDLI